MISFTQRMRGWFTWPRMKPVLKWGAIVTLALVALVSAAVAITFWVYARDSRMPSVSALQNYHPKQVTRIVARGDELVGELYTERRTFVPYEQIPKLVREAFVVAEDAGFYEHGGIDVKGMVRAFFANLFSGSAKQGASTITQQVVKNLLLTPEKTFRRKMQEIILARRLESALTKEEILEIYLNQIYFGNGRYGVLEAARYYFGAKTLEDLDVGQIAYLAGLPQAPEAISHNPERGANRREYVLNQLLKHKKIDEKTARQFVNAPIPPPKRTGGSVAPEVVDLVKQDLKKQYDDAEIDSLGAEVRVSVDPAIQRAARAALQKQLRIYDKGHELGRPVRKVAEGKLDAEMAKLKKRLGSGPKRGEIYAAIVTAVSDQDDTIEVDLGGWKGKIDLSHQASRFNPDKKKASERFAVNDVVEVAVENTTVRFAPGPEGAVVVIDVKTRKVLALVGGFDVRAGDFDRAIQAKRQPGSTFKPFVYAAGIAARRYTAASIVNDAPDVYDLWKPKNYGSCCEGPVRLRYALAKSINTVAIRVCNDLTPAAVAALAHTMGIQSDLPEHLSLSLGSGEVTPLELTNAFATFAAGGKYAPPRIIDAVNGKLVDAVAPVQAIDADVAYVIVDMMKSVLEPGGTGAGARKDLKIPVAGKTGTSNDERDAWFVGMTPELAIGVWVGYDDNRPLGAKQTGGHVALPVFVSLMREIKPRARDFERPPGIVEARIDKATGLLAPEGAPADTSYTEVFLAGTAPTETAVRPGEVDTTTFVTDEYGDGAGGGDAPEPDGDGDGAEPVAHP
jgi:penicillin-binding protein 1A